MSGRCGGLHRPGRSDGGVGRAVVIVLVVIVIASAGRAVAPEALTGLEMALITISGVLAAAVVTGITVLVVLARREALARRNDTRRVESRTVPVPPAAQARVIEPPRRVYGPTYEQRAAPGRVPEWGVPDAGDDNRMGERT